MFLPMGLTGTKAPELAARRLRRVRELHPIVLEFVGFVDYVGKHEVVD